MKKIRYNLIINQCFECSDISDVYIKDKDYYNIPYKHYDLVEQEIKDKFIIGEETYYNSFNPEFLRINVMYKPEPFFKKISTKHFIFNAQITSHKCSRCGGNY